MPLGYDVKEEATEVKKNLFENRDNFIMLVVAGVVGGIGAKVSVLSDTSELKVYWDFE